VNRIRSIAEENYLRKRRETAKAGRDLRRRAKRCAYCRCFLIQGSSGPQGATVDHKVPLVQGGTNAPSNLVACCRSCNSRKTYKTPMQAAMVPK